jgi:hypothetical protein
LACAALLKKFLPARQRHTLCGSSLRNGSASAKPITCRPAGCVEGRPLKACDISRGLHAAERRRTVDLQMPPAARASGCPDRADAVQSRIVARLGRYRAPDAGRGGTTGFSALSAGAGRHREQICGAVASTLTQNKRPPSGQHGLPNQSGHKGSADQHRHAAARGAAWHPWAGSRPQTNNHWARAPKSNQQPGHQATSERSMCR